MDARRGAALFGVVMVLVLLFQWSLVLSWFTDPMGFAPARTEDEVIAWMLDHSDRVSLVAWSVSPSGEVLPAWPAVRHEPEALRPSGVIGALPLALRWSQEVSQGERMETDAVALADWDLDWLPTVDHLAHQSALARHGLAPGDEATVTEADVVRALLRDRDQAAAGWLAREVSGLDVAWSDALDLPPFTLHAGDRLAWSNHGQADPVASPGSPAWADAAAGLLEEFRHDPSFREPELHFRANGGGRLDWSDVVVLQSIGPRASAVEVARMVGRIATGGLVSRSASGRLARLLEWPMASRDKQSYRAFGGLSDAGEGYVVEVAYAMPRQGPTRVVVLMLEGLGHRTWTTMTSTLSHHGLLRRLLDEPAFASEIGVRLRVAAESASR